MRLGRRGFLGGVVGAAALGPKNIAQSASRIARGGIPPGMSVASFDDDEDYEDDNDAMEDDMRGRDRSRPEVPEQFRGALGFQSFLREFGIPEHLKIGWRAKARNDSRIDLDLAANRSMSAAAKVLVQRERNYARQEQEWLENGRAEGLENLFRVGSASILERKAFIDKFPWAAFVLGL